jgi:hypothetical protein
MSFRIQSSNGISFAKSRTELIAKLKELRSGGSIVFLIQQIYTPPVKATA